MLEHVAEEELELPLEAGVREARAGPLGVTDVAVLVVIFVYDAVDEVGGHLGTIRVEEFGVVERADLEAEEQLAARRIDAAKMLAPEGGCFLNDWVELALVERNWAGFALLPRSISVNGTITALTFALPPCPLHGGRRCRLGCAPCGAEQGGEGDVLHVCTVGLPLSSAIRTHATRVGGLGLPSRGRLREGENHGALRQVGSCI